MTATTMAVRAMMKAGDRFTSNLRPVGFLSDSDHHGPQDRYPLLLPAYDDFPCGLFKDVMRAVPGGADIPDGHLRGPRSIGGGAGT